MKKIEKDFKFFHCSNYSYHVLFGRTMEIESKTNFIIVGAGSVGAEVVDCLIKSGISQIKIYDHDFIESYNTPRHLIGVDWYYSGLKQKGIFLANFFKSKYPFFNIMGYDKKFNFNDNIDKNTIIINTTGGSNDNRQANFNKLLDINKSLKIIDIFIEPYCAAAHMIIGSSKKILKNIFDINFDKRYIVKQYKDLRLNFEGCFISTLPYAYIPIKVTIPQLVKKALVNKFKNGHYTSFAIELSGIKEKFLNKELVKKIDKKSSGVIKW